MGLFCCSILNCTFLLAAPEGLMALMENWEPHFLSGTIFVLYIIFMCFSNDLKYIESYLIYHHRIKVPREVRLFQRHRLLAALHFLEHFNELGETWSFPILTQTFCWNPC